MRLTAYRMVSFVQCVDRASLFEKVLIVRHMATRYKLYMSLLVVLCVNLFLCSESFPQGEGNSSAAPISERLTLVQAVMCEGIKDYNPQNQAVVFSVTIGTVSCFTSFDPVPEDMFIYHKWFHSDRLSTKIKLFLQVPRWSTFSSIQLRQADKGPWRVEVTDQEGTILQVLRFSITD